MYEKINCCNDHDIPVFKLGETGRGWKFGQPLFRNGVSPNFQPRRVSLRLPCIMFMRVSLRLPCIMFMRVSLRLPCIMIMRVSLRLPCIMFMWVSLRLPCIMFMRLKSTIFRTPGWVEAREMFSDHLHLSVWIFHISLDLSIHLR